mgnify:CR=1 FL=1
MRDADASGTGGRLVRIEDPADPRASAYLSIRERDLARRDGRFVVEGEVVLRLVAERSPGLVRSVLVAEPRLPRIAPILPRLPAAVPVLVAGQAVADSIAGFHLNRGILAIADRPAAESLETLLAVAPAHATVPVLVGLSNHDNVGGVFRNAAAFGAPFCVLDGESCDPFYRKAVRVSVGGSVVVPHVRVGDLDAALDVLVAAGFSLVALTPRPDAPPVSEVPAGRRVALLLAAEGSGLPDRIIARATPARIPMAAGFDSLNVAVAAGIALATLFDPAGRGKPAPG